MQQTPHVVVVGAGFGGLEVSRRLAREPVRVTLLDKRSYHQFTPLLYQVATAALSPSEISLPIRSVFRKHRNVHTLMAEVTKVDLKGAHVELETGERLRYDYLVIAVGARPHYFGNEEAWSPNVHALKSIDSAARLRESLLLAFEAAEREPDENRRARLLTFCVVGAGPSGVELAGALAELGGSILARDYDSVTRADVRVYLFEAEQEVLPTFPERLRKAARSQLESLGVEVRTNEPIEGVEPGCLRTSQASIPCGMICWGGGVGPAKLAAGVDAKRENGKLVVDRTCSLPEYPRVFAIGDVAHFVDDDGKALPGLAPVALQQARHVARCIRSDLRGEPIPTFRYRDRGIMATVGRSKAVAKVGRLQLSGLIAWLVWVTLHVWFLIGFRARVLVILEWMWAYVASRRGARLVQHEVDTRRLRRFADTPPSAESSRSLATASPTTYGNSPRSS